LFRFLWECTRQWFFLAKIIRFMIYFMCLDSFLVIFPSFHYFFMINPTCLFFTILNGFFFLSPWHCLLICLINLYFSGWSISARWFAFIYLFIFLCYCFIFLFFFRGFFLFIFIFSILFTFSPSAILICSLMMLFYFSVWMCYPGKGFYNLLILRGSI
jgi:hypothetical protein